MLLFLPILGFSPKIFFFILTSAASETSWGQTMSLNTSLMSSWLFDFQVDPSKNQEGGVNQENFQGKFGFNNTQWNQFHETENVENPYVSSSFIILCWMLNKWFLKKNCYFSFSNSRFDSIWKQSKINNGNRKFITNIMFVTSKNELSNSQILEFKVLHKSQRAF